MLTVYIMLLLCGCAHHVLLQLPQAGTLQVIHNGSPQQLLLQERSSSSSSSQGFAPVVQPQQLSTMLWVSLILAVRQCGCVWLFAFVSVQFFCSSSKCSHCDTVDVQHSTFCRPLHSWYKLYKLQR
jgi:hypothetical protein